MIYFLTYILQPSLAQVRTFCVSFIWLPFLCFEIIIFNFLHDIIMKSTRAGDFFLILRLLHIFLNTYHKRNNTSSRFLRTYHVQGNWTCHEYSPCLSPQNNPGEILLLSCLQVKGQDYLAKKHTWVNTASSGTGMLSAWPQSPHSSPLDLAYIHLDNKFYVKSLYELCLIF